LLLNRPDKQDNVDDMRLTQTHLEQINANDCFKDIAEFFESVLYLHLVPQLLRHPEAFSGPGIPGDPLGRSFLERVALTPQKFRNSRLKKIEEALRIAVPQLKQLTYQKADLLSDKGIGGEEVLLLNPDDQEGTKVDLASSIQEIKDLLEGGLSIADAALPRSVPNVINLRG